MNFTPTEAADFLRDADEQDRDEQPTTRQRILMRATAAERMKRQESDQQQ